MRFGETVSATIPPPHETIWLERLGPPRNNHTFCNNGTIVWTLFINYF